MDLPFTFATYFTHHGLIHQIISGDIEKRLKQNLLNAAHLNILLKKHEENRAYNQSIVETIISHEIPSLETMLPIEGQLKVGQNFWVETSMMFKGSSKAWSEVNYDNKRPSYFSFRFSFNAFEDFEFYGELNAEHLYSTSATSALSKRQTKFLFGYVQKIEGKKVTIRTILIGDRIGLNDKFTTFYQPLQSRINLHEIDEFKLVKKIKNNDPTLDLQLNKTIPEKILKQYLAEIIGEPETDKDWGGEKSDLFTTRIHVNGERLRAAFILKGPAKFHKMHMTDLGKRGDQIPRLFEEPVDIFFLQHCHLISSEVIKTMDAFANQIYKQKKYCIIDGIDTQRLLKAYNKIP